MTLDRCYYPSALQLRDDGDGRTLVGPLLPWGVEARVVDRGRLVVETFERGALTGTDPSRVPLTATHPTGAPGTSRTPPSATRSWPWPATAYPSACPWASPRLPGVPLVT